MEIIIKKPSWGDAREVSRKIRVHNQKNSNMLERMPRNIKKSYFWIAKNFSNQLIGFIGLFNWNGDGVEIVSHFVNKKIPLQGVGKKLLSHALTEAKKINSVIFLFTTEVEYYAKFGFKVVEAENFPEKIRLRCQNCPKGGPDGPGSTTCPEIAMIFNGKESILENMTNGKTIEERYMFS